VQPRTRILTVALALAVVALVAFYRPAAAVKDDKDKEEKKAPPSEAREAIRKAGEDFIKAFNKGDAKAVADHWTEEGEFDGSDGEELHGRAEILKDYTEFFKKYPGAKIEITSGTLKLLGKSTATEVGRLKLTLPGKGATESGFIIIHIRDGDDWKFGQVREWGVEPSTPTIKDLEWLVGDWSASHDGTEVTINYTKNGPYLISKYTSKRGDKVVSSGQQILVQHPTQGLRSWMFDQSRTINESTWSHDGNHWVIESTGTLPDGSELTSKNLLIPVSKDSFTWQSTERKHGDVELHNTQPLKVTRVKAER
jgi:uncharacterized protein (TIGR02246 family)